MRIAILCVAVLGIGCGGAQAPSTPQTALEKSEKDFWFHKRETAEEAPIEGAWILVAKEEDGVPATAPPIGTRFILADGKITLEYPAGFEVTVKPDPDGPPVYTTDPTKDPAEMIMRRGPDTGKLVIHNLYRIRDDRLIVCNSREGGHVEPGLLENKRLTEIKFGKGVVVSLFERDKNTTKPTE